VKTRVFRLALAAVLFSLAAVASAQIQFRPLDRDVIEIRLNKFSDRNDEREKNLKQLFAQSGCKNISEQKVRNKLPPNLVCVLPGETDQVIVVGAHSDHVSRGDGVVDNWSGASLLPSLFYSVDGQPRRHTFVFVAFTGEEEGLLGSAYYARNLAQDQRTKISAMVNMDTLALGPTEVWSSHSDKQLLKALASTAYAMKIPVTAMNVDGAGSSDSESFARYNIPRITLHSVTEETWPILHSSRDKIDVVKMDDYYASYRLIAAYLSYLDTVLDAPVPAGKKAAQ
jgi:Zn-dependent M28 family amino/carboxypeptidase